MQLRRWLGLIAVTVPVWAFAQTGSPVGLWKTIDDNSGKPRAIVRISDNGGTLSGKIEKLFLEPQEVQNPRCIECSDARKDQPIVGLTILSGLSKAADPGVWDGGEILDPNNGKVYHCKITVTDDGARLNVRGYIGFALLGRSQVWLRAEP